MQALSQFFIKSKQNKLFVIVVIGICMGVIEFTTHFFSNIPAKMSGGLANQVVAVVQTVQTDVRQKPVEEAGWYRAEPLTEVMRGDAIYSGRQSRSQVKMKSGGILELGEETLVIFDDVDGVTIPDVSRGQVKLKVSGQMKIAISGEVTEFTGAQSELLLNADGTTRNIRVVKGQTSVARKGVVAKSLSTGETLDLPASQAAPPRIAIPKADELITTAKISDKRNVVESKKPIKPVEFAPAPIEKPIETPPAPASVTNVMDAPPAAAPVMEGPEIATTPALPPVAPVVETAPMMPEPVVAKEALAVQEPEVKIDRIMKVQEVYDRKGDRALVPRTGMKFLKVPVALSWQGSAPDDKVFVQVAKDKAFAKPWVEKETAGHNIVIDSWKPGRNFWRVSRDKQSWSEPGEVLVKPTVALAQVPTVTAFKSQVPLHPKGKGPEAEAKLRFHDSGLSKPRGWVLQGSSTSAFEPKKTKTVYVKEPRVDIPLKREGKYFFRIRSVAAAGEISSFSAPVVVKAVKSSAAPMEIMPRLAKQERQEKQTRDLAAIDEQKDFKQDEFKPQDYGKDDLAPRQETAKTTSKVETAVEARDLRPRPWSVTLEGGETALVSSDQLSDSSAPASTHIAALRLRHNDGRNSGSIAYRTKWGGANAEGNAQSNTRLELRYTRWWQTRWAPIRLGWAGGFDSYRNPTATRYSKGYDAAKTGLDVAIKLSDRWKTGGDILVGTWFDSNRVYEFGGFLSYDVTEALAFGVGYRLSLFDAATLESAPLALPYREAMGEAYSSLQFSF